MAGSCPFSLHISHGGYYQFEYLRYLDTLHIYIQLNGAADRDSFDIKQREHTTLSSQSEPNARGEYECRDY